MAGEPYPVGVDTDGMGVWFDPRTGETYNCGEPLTEQERNRVEGDQWPDPDACTDPRGHSFYRTGTAFGGDDERWGGEGRSFCRYCRADGDA